MVARNHYRYWVQEKECCNTERIFLSQEQKNATVDRGKKDCNFPAQVERRICEKPRQNIQQVQNVEPDGTVVIAASTLIHIAASMQNICNNPVGCNIVVITA